MGARRALHDFSVPSAFPIWLPDGFALKTDLDAGVERYSYTSDIVLQPEIDMEKLVIKNIGQILSGKLEEPIYDGDCLVAIDGKISGWGKEADLD